MGRNDLCFCESGVKQKKCHKGINEHSKWANIYKANKEYEEFAKQNDLLSLCPTDCFLCCDATFPVSAEDFYIILDYLCKGNFSLIEEKITIANRISETFQKDFPDAWSILNEKMEQSNQIDLKYWGESFHLNPILPRCMFLSSEGKCEIYDCRPSVCRTFGTTSPCSIISNRDDTSDEVTKLIDTHNTVFSIKGEAIVKRPYPLFYWFTHFLSNESYRNLTKQKIVNVKSISEDAYFRSHRV